MCVIGLAATGEVLGVVAGVSVNVKKGETVFAKGAINRWRELNPVRVGRCDHLIGGLVPWLTRLRGVAGLTIGLTGGGDQNTGEKGEGEEEESLREHKGRREEGTPEHRNRGKKAIGKLAIGNRESTPCLQWKAETSSGFAFVVVLLWNLLRNWNCYTTMAG
jgi:hypothetical protein